MTTPGGYTRDIDGYRYEWREGPRGLGWYNDENQWFLSHDEAERRTGGLVASGGDDNTMGMLAHLLALFTGFLGPLIIYIVKSDSPKVRANAAEALNFEISLLIAGVISFILMFVLIGFVLILGVAIAGLVFPIMGALAANRGEVYRYPFSIRFVKP